MNGRVLVTGASGFVGAAVVARLSADGVPVRASLRRPAARAFDVAVESVSVGAIDATTDWRAALDGVGAVVHCAARVHHRRDTAADPLMAFRAVNRDGTARLARQAAEAGVRRFVCISSIGVNGAETFGTPFRADDTPAPRSPYAVSKHEAEAELARIAAATSLEVVLIRPPLVYGPGAPGNFATLLRALERGWPLPLGAIRNRRSFVAIGNLVDLIVLTLGHPAASGQTFLVSDGEDLSTTGLLRRTAAALGTPARLLPFPQAAVRRGLIWAGRAELGQRLCGSLEVDIRATCRQLAWRPPICVDDALVDTARHHLAQAAEGPSNRVTIDSG